MDLSIFFDALTEIGKTGPGFGGVVEIIN